MSESGGQTGTTKCSQPGAMFKCAECGIALIAILRTFPHFRSFSALIRTFSSFPHHFALYTSFHTVLHNLEYKNQQNSWKVLDPRPGKYWYHDLESIGTMTWKLVLVLGVGK